MRILILCLLALLGSGSAVAQVFPQNSNPGWKSKTTDPTAPSVLAPQFNAAFGAKPDAVNGQLLNPTIQGGSLSGSDVGGTTATGIATVARTLSAKYTERLDIRDFGAVCNGRTDDYQAIQDAVNVATGYVPVGVANAIPGWVTRIANQLASNLATWGVPGINSNGGAEVYIPPGRCVSKQAITITPHQMNTLAIGGAGMNVSEIQFPAGTDGLVFSIPNNNYETRSTAYPGSPIYIHGLALLQADPLFRTIGRALVLKAQQTTNIPVVPIMVDKISINSTNGREQRTQEWAEDIHIEDLQNVYVYGTQLFHYDFGWGTEADVHIISNATGWTGDAPTNIWITDSAITGGLYGVKVDGRNIQGVFVNSTPLTAVGHGVYWKVSSAGFNGPLAVTNSGGSCQYDCIATNYVYTTRLMGNQFIDGQMVSNTNWCAICVDNGGEATIVANTMVNLPNTSTLGSGYTSTGIRFTQMPSTQGHAYGSIVSDNMIGPTDYGLVLAGYNVMGTGNLIETDPNIPEQCYLDQTASSEPGTPLIQYSCNGVVNNVWKGGSSFQGAAQFLGSVAVNGKLTATEDMSVAGQFSATGNGYIGGTLNVNGALVPNNTTVAALPSPCAAGDVRFASDATRSSGGKGALVVCTSTGWAALQTGAVSTN